MDAVIEKKMEECASDAWYRPVFEIRDENQKKLFLSWLLDLPDDSLAKEADELVKENTSFAVLWALLGNLNTFTAVVEQHHVDRVYRDSYYSYYSSKHFCYNRYCRRLSLFSGILEKEFLDYSTEELNKCFLGEVTIRPIADHSIGRTLLSPRVFLEKKPCFIRLTNYSMTILGKRLDVSAFPYSMQDGETTSCAETTILNLSDYYSHSYPEYRLFLPSEISSIAEKNSFERRLPTTGLSYELISRIFCEMGFYPRLYSTQKMDKRKFLHIMHYYIESGIPIALGLAKNTANKHSVIGIGYASPDLAKLTDQVNCAYNEMNKTAIWVCDTADTVSTYCIMDDNRRPYFLCDCREIVSSIDNSHILTLGDYRVEYMMVPLYKRMIMEAADVYDICLSILSSDKLCIRNFFQCGQFANEAALSTLGDVSKCGTKEEPLVIRLFMASSRTFRKNRDESLGNNVLKEIYNTTVFPKFVWVCELSTPLLYSEGKVMGEIIIDATSSAEAKMNSFIMLHYPGAICRRQPERQMTKLEEPGDDGLDYETFVKVEDWRPFNSFADNLRRFGDD